MSGQPVQSISWGRAEGTKQWQEEDAPVPPSQGTHTPPEKETAFDTSAFPVPLGLSPSTMWEVAAPAPKPGEGKQQPLGGFSAA